MRGIGGSRQDTSQPRRAFGRSCSLAQDGQGRARARRRTKTPTRIPDDVLDAEIHAGRLHALIMGLICTDDTPQVMEDAEKADVQRWLISMARTESCRLRLSLAQREG